MGSASHVCLRPCVWFRAFLAQGVFVNAGRRLHERRDIGLPIFHQRSRVYRLSTSDADGFSRAPRLVLCVRFLFEPARALPKKCACSDRFKIIARAIIVYPLYRPVPGLGRAICKSPVVEEVQYFCPPIVDHTRDAREAGPPETDRRSRWLSGGRHGLAVHNRRRRVQAPCPA